MNTTERDALHLLLSGLVDGTATDDQLAELAQRLERDAETRRFYLRYLDMHAALTGRSAVLSHVPRRSPWAAILGGLLAASLMIGWLGLSAVVQPLGKPPAADPAAPASSGYVATIATCSENAVLNESPVADGSVRRTVDAKSDAASHELIMAGVGRRYELGLPKGSEIPLNAALVQRTTPGPLATTSPPAASDDFAAGGTRIGGLASGAGWKNPWIRHDEAGFPELELVSPGLSGDRSLAVVHDATADPVGGRKTAAHRLLAEPINLAQDGIWYVRFLIRRGPAAAGDEHLGMVVLRTYGLTAQEEIDRETTIKLAAQGDDGAAILFADTSTRAALPMASGQTYAVVAKIVAGRTNPDQVFMRIMAADRLAGAPEPNDWSVASSSIDTGILLDQISLEFVSKGRIELGDLCVGPAWESISQPIASAGR